MPGRSLVLYQTDGRRITLEALAEAAGLHPDVVYCFIECGLLEPSGMEERIIWFDVRAVWRLRKIRRLREDLGINLSGIAVVLDLLDRIEALERELANRSEH